MTDQQDVINGAIETVAGLLQFVNAYALYRDKQIKGTSYWSVIFYVGWGVWGGVLLSPHPPALVVRGQRFHPRVEPVLA